MLFSRPNDAEITTMILLRAGVVKRILTGEVFRGWRVWPSKYVMWVQLLVATDCASGKERTYYLIVVEYSSGDHDGLQYVIHLEANEPLSPAPKGVSLEDDQMRIVAELAKKWALGETYVTFPVGMAVTASV